MENQSDAAMIPFNTHQDALRALCQVGYADAEVYPDFDAETLVAAVSTLVDSKSITVLDMTACVPNTASAAYQALTVLGVHGGIYSKKDDNAAFLILRTEENTPSFLFGVHYSIVQCFGKEVADEHVRKHPTPAAFVFFRGRQIPIPSSVCHVDELLASKFIASEILQSDDCFSCGLCQKGFVKRLPFGSTVDEVAVTPCGHTFHRDCAIAHIKNSGSAKCPVCDNSVVESAPASA